MSYWLHRQKRSMLLVFLLNIVFFSIAALFSPASFAATRFFSDKQAIAAGESACASPPADFNPLTTSEQDLLYYGLPARPAGNDKQLKHWLSIVKAAKKRGCTFTTQHHNRPTKPVPSTKPTVTPTPHPTLPTTTPTPSVVKPQVGSQSNDYETNWSGYVAGQAQAQVYNYVRGEWDIPCIIVGRTNTGSQEATWVGLGGWNYTNLWQAGTEIETGTPASGSPTSPVYHMWYEAWPFQDMVIDSQNLHCGDHIYAEVDTQRANPYSFVEDITLNEYIPAYSGYIPDRTTAEWIDERPSCPYSNDQLHQLPGFQPINWSNAYSMRSDASGYLPIDAYNYKYVTMYYQNSLTYEYLTDPGSLVNGGTGFTDTFKNNGVGSCGLALKDTLTVSQRLNVGDHLNSQDYRYYLMMQSDGNLVLYNRDDGGAKWASHTNGQGSSYTIMQPDGNLVIYRNSDGKPTWSTRTGGTGTNHLTLQVDGNLVLYNSSNNALWASHTNCYQC